MGDKSAIQWTDATWNPTTGCDRVSPGCAHCYALDYAPRLKAMAIAQGAGPDAPYMRDGDPKTSGPGFGLMVHPDRLELPLRWKRPRRIFVNSMSDLFHEEVPDDFLDRVFAVMALAEHHTFQVLTKRPERMREYLTRASGRIADTIVRMRRERGDKGVVVPLAHVRPGAAWWPLPNVWLGVSVENARWRTRIAVLRQAPAVIRFLSCEPLLGPLTPGLALSGIHWVIVGGESAGPPERRLVELVDGEWRPKPVALGWVRDIALAARRQGAAFFFKQWGGRTPKSGGRELDGRTWDEFPRQAVPA